MRTRWYFHHEWDGWHLFVLVLKSWRSFKWPSWLPVPR